MEEKKKMNYWPIIIIVLLVICFCVLALGVILIAISAQGISIAQRNARNTARKSIAQDIVLNAVDFNLEYRAYPEKIEFKNSKLILSDYSNELESDRMIANFNNVEIYYDVSKCNRDTTDTELIVCYDLKKKELEVVLEEEDNYFMHL